MKILLFGKYGQVGWELQRALASLGELTVLGAADCDFSAPDRLREVVAKCEPEVIVNAAAYTAVDRAEKEPDLAFAVNSEAPGILAREASRRGAWLVHYSTDYVFDGSGARPWREADSPNPLSVYGRSKLAGERAIQSAGCRYLIFRTSWVYAARGGNFPKTILRRAQEQEGLRIIDDQIGAPSGAELLADVTAHAIRTAIVRPETAGLYHLAAQGEVSWYGYACFVLQTARALGFPVKARPESIEPIPSRAYPTPAVRPLNSRLNTDLLQRTFALHLPDWQTGVGRMVREICELRG
ncbi:MAG: dTDP-4-dehydrorhamnose reductase [Gammaproteobacteria bacterium]